MEPLVYLKDIEKTYQTVNEETCAIKGFSLKIYSSDFIAIVGPSGCGKSTVLSIIAGLCLPSSGEIIMPKSLSVGYMLQRDHLLSWRNIYQNTTVGLEVQKKLNNENIAYVNYLIETYGLSRFRNSYPNQLSGGMRQRAALIRTLAIKPDILLLDEPFSALDYQTRLTVSDDVGEIIAKEGKTAVLVTHDLSEAISMASKVVVMSARPSTIKNIYDISFPNCTSMPEKRKDPKFAQYFEKIWKDIDKNE